VTRQVLTIDGMSCGHCVKAVTLALQHVPGVEVRRVDVGTAEVVVDDSVATRGQLTEAIEEAGYTLRDAAPAGPA
jgi:copper chaperone